MKYFAGILLALTLLLAVPANAQVPNPPTPGFAGGFDQYGNAYPVYGKQIFSTGSIDYPTSCLASPNAPVTISIASPAIVTVANTCAAGQAVVFNTSGALPTGLTAGTLYYVIAAGLSNASFEVSTTIGGGAVNTSGTQSGVQLAATPYINATTSYTAAIALPPIPASFTVVGHCEILWQTNNTADTITFAMQPSNTTSTLQVLNTAHYGAGGATLADKGTTITSSGTPTAISAAITATAANTTYRDDIFFQLTTSSTGSQQTTVSLYAVDSGTNGILFMPGSYCVVGN